MILLNAVLIAVFGVVWFNASEFTSWTYMRYTVSIPYDKMSAALMVLFACNILYCVGCVLLRMLKHVWTSVFQRKPVLEDKKLFKKHLLRDTSPAKQSPSPAPKEFLPSSSSAQTPLRSPFAKHTSSGTSLTASSSHLSVKTNSTPLMTPSSKAINLKTPSALLTSPNSPFSVKTPVEKMATEAKTQSNQQPESNVQINSSPNPLADSASPKTKHGKLIDRKVIKGDDCLTELLISRDFEDRMESMRRWLWSMIIKPLVDDIDRVEAAFQANGLSHLGPLCPASLALSMDTKGQFDLRAAFFVSPGTIGASSRPHTLMDLAQSSRHDPMVQARLRIEKYLDVAAGVGRVAAGPRVALVNRLRAMARNPFYSTASPSEDQDDAVLLMHLFCTFLDEHLPSSDFYSAQPFSSKYFLHCPAGGTEATKLDIHNRPICIVQSGGGDFVILFGNEQAFIPVAANMVGQTLQTLVLFTAIVEKRLAGHLGIANLSSRSVRLIGFK